MKFTLSLAMIVKNEEIAIERVLESARLVCDEMIVVDTGSTDRTVELAERMGAKVLHFKWIDDFSAARNFSFDQCSGDWILLLDADDLLPVETQEWILKTKLEGISPDIDVFEMVYNYKYDATGRCIETQFMPRLIRNLLCNRWENPVHEQLFFYRSRSRQLENVVVEHRQDTAKHPERHDRIKRIIGQAIDQGVESVQMLFYFAEYLYNDGKWSEAIDYYEKYLSKPEIAWSSYDALVRLSLCRYFLGDLEAMKLWAQKALEVDGERAEAFVLLGSYHIERQEWEEAIPLFERATTCVRPFYPLAIDAFYTWVPWDRLSQCYTAKERFADAAECAEKALRYGSETERIAANLEYLRGRISQS